MGAINSAKAIGFGLALCLMASFSACGGSSSQSTNSSSNMAATVNITVSDPHTCARPSGPFAHSYVTITDVQIQASSSAGPNDPGSSAEAIFPRCQANLIEEFERSPPFAYLRSGCRVGRGSRQLGGALHMLASSLVFAALSSACFSVLLSSSGNGSVQLQAVSRSFACVQSGPWYSFVIVISVWASFRDATDKLILKPLCGPLPSAWHEAGACRCAGAT